MPQPPPFTASAGVLMVPARAPQWLVGISRPRLVDAR
jgi:hypothetical protein